MKQTAVEWLVNELNQKIDFIPINKWGMIRDIVQQAKAREKQQIIDAYEIGFADAWDDARYDDSPTYAGAEQYYNEIYKSKL